jgi:NAD(P)-dependent dehydrogenase (short-subunit alcohol dehydrogenase family)
LRSWQDARNRWKKPLQKSHKKTATAKSPTFACDVTDPQAVIATHQAVIERFGPVDILVNNAGQSAAKPFSQISDEEWQADLDLKLMAAVRLTRLVWPSMQERKWGRVINLLNVYAKTPDANTAPTSISRAAGMALTKVLSAEGAADNILVNALLIGFLESDQIRRRHEASGSNDSLDDFIAKAGERLPYGTNGTRRGMCGFGLILSQRTRLLHHWMRDQYGRRVV